LGKHKGWLLLPGYETQTAGNAVWQSTMRAALSGATGAIVVTDATRLARDQGDLARDAFGHGLKHVEPLVVISKTEALRDRPEDLADLQERGAKAFDVPVQRVQCIGMDDGMEDGRAYLEGWRKALKGKIDQFVAGKGEDREGRWHAEMSNLLRQDLKLVLSDLNRHLRLMFMVGQDAGAAADMVKSGLDIFDAARDKLRKAYDKSVRRVLDEHRGTAEMPLKRRLEDDFEGLANHALSFFDTDTGRLIKLEKAITEADQGAGKVGPLVVAALEEPIRQALNLQSSRLGQAQASQPLAADAPTETQLPTVTSWSQAVIPTVQARSAMPWPRCFP
jgi:hypothetical protein